MRCFMLSLMSLLDHCFFFWGGGGKGHLKNFRIRIKKGGAEEKFLMKRGGGASNITKTIYEIPPAPHRK